MQDRFKFKAIVKGYYYDECEEFEPLIFLENIDVLDIGDIGIPEEDLEIAIRKQYSNLQDIYVERMMEIFRDNSNGVDTYITITPEQIYQCTGQKDKNGKLIYEADILKGKKNMICSPHSSRMVDKVGVVEIPQNMFVASCRDVKNNCTLFCQKDWVKTEVIGNIYENPELLED